MTQKYELCVPHIIIKRLLAHRTTFHDASPRIMNTQNEAPWCSEQDYVSKLPTVVYQNGGPRYKAQNATILILGTLK